MGLIVAIALAQQGLLPTWAVIACFAWAVLGMGVAVGKAAKR